MPLSMAPEGKESVIRKIGGKEETRLFLERLGFVVGAIVTVALPVPDKHRKEFLLHHLRLS